MTYEEMKFNQVKKWMDAYYPVHETYKADIGYRHKYFIESQNAYVTLFELGKSIDGDLCYKDKQAYNENDGICYISKSSYRDYISWIEDNINHYVYGYGGVTDSELVEDVFSIVSRTGNTANQLLEYADNDPRISYKMFMSAQSEDINYMWQNGICNGEIIYLGGDTKAYIMDADVEKLEIELNEFHKIEGNPDKKLDVYKSEINSEEDEEQGQSQQSLDKETYKIVDRYYTESGETYTVVESLDQDGDKHYETVVFSTMETWDGYYHFESASAPKRSESIRNFVDIISEINVEPDELVVDTFDKTMTFDAMMNGEVIPNLDEDEKKKPTIYY